MSPQPQTKENKQRAMKNTISSQTLHENYHVLSCSELIY